jgi:ABC-type multidrug transport system permease subunit
MSRRLMEPRYLMPAAIVIAVIVGTFFLFYIAFFGVQPGL